MPRTSLLHCQLAQPARLGQHEQGRVFRLSCVKTQAWLAVQETTVKAIAIDTSRLACQTRRAALRIKLRVPDEIEELFQGGERPLK